MNSHRLWMPWRAARARWDHQLPRRPGIHVAVSRSYLDDVSRTCIGTAAASAARSWWTCLLMTSHIHHTSQYICNASKKLRGYNTILQLFGCHNDTLTHWSNVSTVLQRLSVTKTLHHRQTHTHNCLTAHCPGLPGRAGTWKTFSTNIHEEDSHRQQGMHWANEGC